MDSVESIIWLKKNNLFKQCLKYATQLKVVFNTCLDVKEEDVLIVGDTGYKDHYIAPLFAGSCFLVARSLNLNAKLVLQEAKKKGEYVSGEVKSAIEMIRPGSVLLLSLSERLGSLYSSGKTFRRFCQERRLRYTTTPSLGSLDTNLMTMLVKTINVDYKSMTWIHKEVKKMLDLGDVVHITTKAGTDLRVPINGCSAIASDGIYTKPGLGGNLPGGEVFIAPAKKGVEGKIVVDASSRNMNTTVLVTKPFTIFVEKGKVVDIQGGKEADMLRESIEWAEKNAKYDWGIKRIGELGIGLNPNARISGSMIIDEKVKKTAHVAIGSNYWFGGTVYAMIHLDQVFKNPKITVDGRFLEL